MYWKPSVSHVAPAASDGNEFKLLFFVFSAVLQVKGSRGAAERVAKFANFFGNATDSTFYTSRSHSTQLVQD